MTKTDEKFTKRLLAGIEGSFENITQDIKNIAQQNRDYRLAWALVEVSKEIISMPTFQKNWPKCVVERALQTPELILLVEEIGARTDIQAAEHRKIAAKTMQSALSVITKRLQTSDCGIHHARDAADLAFKINNAASSMQLSEPINRARSVRIFNRVATVESPEHPNGIQLSIVNSDSGLQLFSMMRCTEINEFRKVWGLLKASLFTGSLTLKGW